MILEFIIPLVGCSSNQYGESVNTSCVVDLYHWSLLVSITAQINIVSCLCSRDVFQAYVI
jgi:hypothetical protein